MAGRTLVGFGFGAIQAGLFLYEAQQSGAFDRLVVAEVVPEICASLRGAGGTFTVNFAHLDFVEQAQVSGAQIENPGEAADRERLIAAIATAQEISTAIPSVRFYATDDAGSVHRLIAEGLRRKVSDDEPRAVIYTAENDLHANTILEQQVMDAIPAGERDAVRSKVRFLNTVIAKQSVVITDPAEIEAQHLTPVVPGADRAFLVETYNRILINKIDFDEPFDRGLAIFEEKTDLIPFEEAKFFGHNGIHAIAAYLGMLLGAERIADLRERAGIYDFLKAALIEEIGPALIQKHAGVDNFFTEAGIREWVEDLMPRSFNPFLRDTVARVGRDPARKLGWNDRLIGAMRMALNYGITPRRYALGAAAAVKVLDEGQADKPLADVLPPLWANDSPDSAEQSALLDLIAEGQGRLNAWVDSGFADVASTGFKS